MKCENASGPCRICPSCEEFTRRVAYQRGVSDTEARYKALVEAARAAASLPHGLGGVLDILDHTLRALDEGGKRD